MQVKDDKEDEEPLIALDKLDLSLRNSKTAHFIIVKKILSKVCDLLS